ncbi:MAG: LysR family transcriptional regulator, partial [Oscillospiraceae bacterium]
MDTAKSALLAAAELGSISKAADSLGYTQSGVTHIVNSLEEAGFPLLLRGNRGVRLTAEGERLAPLMRELLQNADRLEQEMALTRGVERGTVRIGTYSSISLRWIPRILEAFQERYPGISVELLEGNGPEIEEWLSSGRIDIAFTSLQPHFNFDTIKIQDDPMMAVLPRTHPMAGAEVFPIGRFKGEPFLVYTTTSNVPDEDLARA